ncbi:hypothetical protein [Sphaerisporangium rubeum]|uniref:Uncharacterized protein n=1 Tax=Sphaerisporangium rubeum TaxID=321317 RepID=A0A7X0ILG9_9ACTN|nr:hypothetical protein [Sphaerisporangium rubeum]MBB6476188.1 hypothetical protein [Sphaerisporangium rubeum]
MTPTRRYAIATTTVPTTGRHQRCHGVRPRWSYRVPLGGGTVHGAGAGA